MPTVRTKLRIEQALNDTSASNELNALLDALDPGGDGALDAADVVYDNSSSGLAATDTQAAVDEVEARVDTAETDVVTAQAAADAAQADVDVLNTALSTPNGTGVTVTEAPGLRKAVVTLAATPVALVDEAGIVAYGGLKILDLPEGLITFLGAVADLAVTKDAAGVNDDWDGDFALGTATAGIDATLTGTEADLIPSTATPQAVAGATTATGLSTGTEAPALFDGSTTAVDVFLNFLVDDADHDVTTTPTNLVVSGTVTVLYALAGDIA